jgi:cation diffusion facilitator family transporter
MKRNLQIHGGVVALGFVLLLIKFIAYFITDSNAILSDALESIVNVATGIFAFFSLWLAGRPKDKSHPYGHGKIEFISAGLEGALIIVAGLFVIGKAIYNFIHPQQVQNLEIGLLLAALTGIINFIMGYVLQERGKKSNSILMTASGKHLMSDAYTTLGLIVGLVLVWLSGQSGVDNIVALLFGVYIISVGFNILREALAGIMDEADEKVLSQLLLVLNQNRQADWIDMHNLRLIKFGSRYHFDCHITIPWYYNVKQAHTIMEKLENTICDNFSESEVFIHTDPCLPNSCKVCRKTDCSVRVESAYALLEWDLLSVLTNAKHG